MVKKAIILIFSVITAVTVNVTGNSNQLVSGKPTTTEAEISDVEFITDTDKGLHKLESLFDMSTQNIYISMYTLTNNKVIDRILNTKNPQRKVFLILDHNEAQKSNDYKKLLGKNNIHVKFKATKTSKGKIDTYYKYHKKIGIFDGKIIFTGSSNWTEYGFGKNDEQNFIIRSKTVAAKAKEEFLKEWWSIK